jgi:hypothetical protein
MSEILKEVLVANSAYSGAFGEKGKLALPPSRRIPIYGYIYNVRTGQLEEVPEATKVGAV